MKKIYALCSLLLICMGAFSQTESQDDGYVSPFEIIEKDLQLGATEPDFYVGYGKKLNFGHNGDNMDDIHFVRHNIRLDQTDFILNLGDDYSDRFIIGRQHWSEDFFTPQFIFKTNGKMGIGIPDPTVSLDVNGTIRADSLLITNGNVGIGTDNPQNKLDVNGTIRAKEILVESDWADFVFKRNYKLPTLREVEEHIKEKGTLPNVPSEEEVKANGISVGKTNALLLQKIEELTLYVIQQQKAMEQQQKEIEELKLRIIQ